MMRAQGGKQEGSGDRSATRRKMRDFGACGTGPHCRGCAAVCGRCGGQRLVGSPSWHGDRGRRAAVVRLGGGLGASAAAAATSSTAPAVRGWLRPHCWRTPLRPCPPSRQHTAALHSRSSPGRRCAEHWQSRPQTADCGQQPRRPWQAARLTNRQSVGVCQSVWCISSRAPFDMSTEICNL